MKIAHSIGEPAASSVVVDGEENSPCETDAEPNSIGYVL